MKDQQERAELSLDQLSPSALSAAIRGGTINWGRHGSSEDHIRYAEPVPTWLRRRCRCGCKRRATHSGMANGVALTHGCELTIRRWVRTGSRT
jgi:hypothetical protein